MELKEITINEVKLLWHTDWYDGELTGFLEYEGIFCQFDMSEDIQTSEGWVRKFNIYPLTISEAADEKLKQEWRKTCVGNDNEYGQEKTFYLPNASWDEYSKKYPEDNKRYHTDRSAIAILII